MLLMTVRWNMNIPISNTARTLVLELYCTIFFENYAPPIFPFFSCHFKGIHMLLYHTFNKSLVGASLRNFTHRCGEPLCLAHFFHIHKFIITVQILFKSSGTLSHTHTLVSELTSGGCSNFSKSTLFFCSAESLAIVLSKDRATCWKEKAEI